MKRTTLPLACLLAWPLVLGGLAACHVYTPEERAENAQREQAYKAEASHSGGQCMSSGRDMKECRNVCYALYVPREELSSDEYYDCLKGAALYAATPYPKTR